MIYTYFFEVLDGIVQVTMDGAWHEEAFLTYLPLPERLSAAGVLVSFV